MTRLLTTLLVVLAIGACTTADADPQQMGAEEEPSTGVATAQGPVALATSAAPAGVSGNATIMEFNDAGELVELRSGTNGWWCLPDENPAAPGAAPICVDGPWQDFFAAYMAGEEPEIEQMGVSYMLAGGSFASNEDPFAEGPAEGGEWLHDGPHLMIVVPDPALLEGFPREHRTDGPYVMWAGTPYAHLMVPVSGN